MHNNNDNPRVKCIVNTCKYYGAGDHCTASQIAIEPRNAQTCEMTDCSTFAPKG